VKTLPPPERRIAGLLARLDHLHARLGVLEAENRALRREADAARLALADLLKKESPVASR
jgi:uncharacterized membrane protein